MLRRHLAIVVTIALGATVAVAASSASISRGSDWRAKVEPAVLSAAAAGPTPFLVYLHERADLSGAELLRGDAKGQFVYDRLTAVAQRSQAPVIAVLEALGAAHHSFWISNIVWTSGDLGVVEAVASLPDVAHVYPIGEGRLVAPVRSSTPAGDRAARGDRVAGVEPNLTHVGAPAVWALGYQGQGAVVAGADTGVRWAHNSLKNKYRGWNGTAADHNYNWKDGLAKCLPTPALCLPIVPDAAPPCPVPPSGQQEPCDDDQLFGGGHGTHTVSTAVGDDGVGNQVGMAPAAQWMACRNMRRGVGVVPTYMECMQWFLAPTRLDGSAPDVSKRPHVTNNSWGCIEGCAPPALKDSLLASRASGIFYAVSAGNEGPSCMTTEFPLSVYRAAYTVGATNKTNDTIADFSSRGAAVTDAQDSPHIEPDITAPGVSIRAAQAWNGTTASNTQYGSLDGTSMAGPHVAGLVALIISAKPSLARDVGGIENIISVSAVQVNDTSCGGNGGAGQDNVYGWGRINALAAVNLARGPTAVKLVSFNAVKTRSAVALRWRAGTGIGALGFNVWRSSKRAGKYTKVNRSLIRATTQAHESSYGYVDRTAKHGTAGFYKLQLVAASGPSAWAGPIRAS